MIRELIRQFILTDDINKLPEVNVVNKEPDVKAKDVRQEPPIPVERVIVTEKPSIEKLDKIAAGTSVPEIKGVIETMKALNGNLNVQSQNIVTMNPAKLDEPVTLKSEEKIKQIEEKEQAADLQKNADNLINLDAIRKEESELAADGDVANARAAERHEQLRKTLEKHKLEQRQMMQEQKEILKDIKEQKQEFEREKQRMAKDEILKKSEKAETSAKEDVPAENKSNLRDISKRAGGNNEVNLEEGDKKVEEGLSAAEKIKLNAKPQSGPDEGDDANIAVNSGERKVDLPQEISRDKNVKESQNAADNVLPIDKTVADRQTFARSSLRKEKQDEAKGGTVEANNSENMKGPILNVLSKGVLQRSIVEEGLPKEIIDNRQMKEEKRDVLKDEVINASDKSQAKFDDRFSVPVALKMMNQSKVDKPTVVASPNKSQPEVLAIGRDILGNEREKRDVDEADVSANDTKVGDHPSERSELLVRGIDDADETCSKDGNARKSEPEKQSEKRAAKPSTTEASLIKTNVYLSEQAMTKAFSIDTHEAFASEVEYANVKRRDFKALNHKDNVEI